MEAIRSSISSITMEWWWSSDMKASQIVTLSFFIFWFSSLGTHLADFFDR